MFTKNISLALLAMTSLLFSFTTLSQEADGGGGEDSAALKDNSIQVKQDLEGFNFGVALGFELYDEAWIESAEIVGDDKIVTITDRKDHNATLWLETHYTWTACKQVWLPCGNYTFPGFYIGARVLGQDSSVFDAFSIGGMYTFARNKKRTDGVVNSINVGFGPVWHRTQRLADGITAGEALPENFDDIKLVKEDEVTWMIMVSAGFQL